MRWPSPKNKLVLAFALLGVLVLLAPGHGISAAAVARIVLGAGALAALAFWAYRRGNAPARFQLPGRLTVAARAGLSPRCSLALVEADGRTFLVAFGDGFAEIHEAPVAPRNPRQARKGRPLTRRGSSGSVRRDAAR